MGRVRLMTTPLIAPASIEDLEYTVPCGCEGCSHDADWMGMGSHTIFGCPGHGPVCEFHRRLTLHYLTSVAGEEGTCRCGQRRVMDPDDFRFIAL